MSETKQKPTDETITSTEAAAILRVDRSIVNYYVKTGKLVPARKLPGATGTYLFVESEVRALAKDRAKSALEEAQLALAAAEGDAA